MLIVTKIVFVCQSDGKPDELKGSCPVQSGGKSGDNIKGLPITIGNGESFNFADTFRIDEKT